MQLSVLRLPHSSASWQLVEKYWRVRSDAFVERMGWPLGLIDGVYEAENYDAAPLAHYVVAHDGRGNVLGGARLLRCDTEFTRGDKKVSYMIRDAHLGRIDLPRSIWSDGIPPTDTRCWELSRLVSADRNPDTAKAILSVCNSYLKKHAAERCLFLTSPAVLRLAKRYGYSPVAKGPVVNSADGRFLAFECPVV